METKNNWKPLPNKSILASVERVFKTRDIDKLTGPAYKALANMSGFIAHYDINGFKHRYQNTSELAEALLNSGDATRPNYYRESWFVERYGKEYCDSKADLYAGLATLAQKYSQELTRHDFEKTKEWEIDQARHTLIKYGITA